MSDLLEKLAKDIDYSDWPMLHWHFVRDSLFIVDEKLDLADAALAIAENNEKQIGAWIESKEISRPSGEDVEKWRKEQQIFKCVVVSPFVLAQLSELPEGVEIQKPEEN